MTTTPRDFADTIRTHATQDAAGRWCFAGEHAERWTEEATDQERSDGPDAAWAADCACIAQTLQALDTEVTLCATPWAALCAWEADEGATLLTIRTATGPLYAVGRWPAVGRGHVGWRQVSPEEVQALLR